MPRKTIIGMAKEIASIVEANKNTTIKWTLAQFAKVYGSDVIPADKWFDSLKKELIARKIVLGYGKYSILFAEDK
jgi:hypothetical protein